MKTQIKHDQHDNAIMGTVTKQVGPPAEWKTFTVVVPNCARLTDGRRLEIGRILWGLAGRETSVWDRADHATRFRWCKGHMGRYRFVEIFTYDDETWGYRADSSGGGDWPLDQLRVISVGNIDACVELEGN